MGLRIVEKTHVVWPCEIQNPLDGGKTELDTLHIKFKRVTEEKFAELTAQGQTHFLREVIEEAGNTEDEVAPLDNATKEKLIAQTNYRVGLYQGYLRMDAGAATKN